MEYVEAILYHKILGSDFTNMYGVKKPKTGGGQTYVQAAGYTRLELETMFGDAKSVTDTLECWSDDPSIHRKNYVFDAYTVGDSTHAEIELAPRTGRKDYRICRQNIKYRHPAWQKSNGFPEPRQNSASDYIYEKDYPGIIDNLYILIVKTVCNNNHKYYATYINSESIPTNWPKAIMLENIFNKSKSQGILFFTDQFLRFQNNFGSPFIAGSAIDIDLATNEIPEDINETIDDAIEYASKDIDISIDITENIIIEKVDKPIIKRIKRSSKKKISKDKDYARRYKNLKKLGDIGEEITLFIEKERLTNEGRPDLAKKVEQISKTIGDGLGYDVLSFELVDGKYVEKYIEVKTTTGGKNKPFDVSVNEVEVSKELADRYYIYRFFGVGIKNSKFKYYESQGAIDNNFTLEPTSYKAYIK